MQTSLQVGVEKMSLKGWKLVWAAVETNPWGYITRRGGGAGGGISTIRLYFDLNLTTRE